MTKKHLKRIKKSDAGISEEDEWQEIPTLGQKIEDQLLEEISDRSFEIKKDNTDNINAYEKESPKIKDDFSNTAQYFKVTKKLMEEKNNSFKNFKNNYERFDKEIDILQPKKYEVKFQPDNPEYKDVKVSQLKQELIQIDIERQEIKTMIIHFNNQIKQSQAELDFKVEQIDDIKLELERLEKKEALQQKIQTEQDAIDVIKQELDIIGDPDESKRVFHSVNTVIEILNSKNKITESELNSVKEEFSELKKKYSQLISKLK